MRFWDSSALVPLVVTQARSSQVDSWLGADAELVVWTLTPVEIVSALRRLVREGALAPGAALEAETRAEELVRACHVVIDVEATKSQARRLLRLHPLRAGDALQLAAALEWANGRPEGHALHSLDDRLSDAARLEGFLVNPES